MPMSSASLLVAVNKGHCSIDRLVEAGDHRLGGVLAGLREHGAVRRIRDDLRIECRVGAPRAADCDADEKCRGDETNDRLPHGGTP